MSAEIAVKARDITKHFVVSHNALVSLYSLFAKRRVGEANGIVKRVIHPCSIDIERGRFVGVIGKNGSGKSTFLKIVSGVYKPNSGDIQVFGQIAPFLELGAGFRPELSVYDNIRINGQLIGIPKRKLLDNWHQILEFAGLPGREKDQLKRLSTGMRIRLAFSIALNSDANIYILDEVMSVGDVEFRDKSFEELQKKIKNDTTVFFASHNEHHIRNFCDSVIYINDGYVKYYEDVELGIGQYRQDLNNNKGCVRA